MQRGIGYSFGYNKVETNNDLLSSVDKYAGRYIVSKNGNLLINIGPKLNEHP